MKQIPDAPWVRDPETYANEYYHIYGDEEEQEEDDD